MMEANIPPQGDTDTDLSFEALTFGEDSGHIKKDKSYKKKPYKKDRSTPQSVCTLLALPS